MKFVVVGLVVLAALCALAAGEGAQLLARKDILSSTVVKDRDMTIQFTVFNVGSSTAYDIKLDDVEHNDELFELKVGLPSVSWPVLPAGANLTHTYVVVPKFEGVIPIGGARLSYRPTRGADVKYAVTSALGELPVNSLQLFRKIHGGNYEVFGKFLGAAVATLVFPFLLWAYARATTTDGLANSKR
ncbi:uncharacterized protein AMSG_04499 [Thecamonas trahens ATCC 50062]|uniref:Translocon-associated protein subunit beta n=1 Tax=Thecamonas trahens ATCC 50062 TaxID=461836 RepID=A0A0L0D7D8_THETB|nr:hypothetical protein AMSG_04499 [Thecamonas trahens ATCC 50062]KNC48269.1 hypothetical protein AMSG_04499 [Thecamonas trahens ATCC 50062]|eukprot:XP_013758836.1 hypothetical protein AMSG_04499 [Thecamonas trahens ATCC 50062]